MKLIIGKKVNMSQKFDAEGNSVPVTIVEAGPCQITQIKTTEKDTYQAIQVGYGKAKRLNKAKTGHLKDVECTQHLREFRVKKDEAINFKKGDKIDVTQFAVGDLVKISGFTKGRGFQGVVKRHGFAGGQASHGHKDQLRMPGSIGERSFPGKVFRGQRMGGHMGDVKVTISNLKIIAIEPEKNLLYINGSIPGARNGIILIYA